MAYKDEVQYPDSTYALVTNIAPKVIQASGPIKVSAIHLADAAGGAKVTLQSGDGVTTYCVLMMAGSLPDVKIPAVEFPDGLKMTTTGTSIAVTVMTPDL